MGFKGSLKINLWVLSIVSGLVLWLSWPMNSFPYLIFIGFVPLFLIQELLLAKDHQAKGYFKYVFLAVLIWNVGTTWWVSNSTLGGGVMANVFNSLFMTIPFMVSFRARKVLGQKEAFFAFIFLWLTFEYIHFNWDLAWPWLALGHVFATTTSLIQWYEFTGVLGGSVWVLLLNWSFFNIAMQPKIGRALLAVFLFVVPLIISFSVKNSRSKQFSDPSFEVVSIQPNIDPYKEKFSYGENFIPFEEQLTIALKLSDSLREANTKLVIWPETSIPGKRYEKGLKYDPEISRLIKASIADSVDFLVGVETWMDFQNRDSLPEGVKFREDIGYYLNYNTALMVSGTQLDGYHKSRFVPGVEKVPFPSLLNWVTKLIKFQGAGTYGSDEYRKVVYTRDSIGIAPLICYESVFGEFVGEYAKNGANVICVITNDAWWDNTDGHKHHNAYARFRAIELRKPVIRSANTGVTSIINPLGEEEIATSWWNRTAIKGVVQPTNTLTFYAEYGDYIGRLAAFCAVVMIFVVYVQKRTKNM